VPEELKHRPFWLDEARALGITPSALRGKSYQRIAARLYKWTDTSVDAWALIDAYRRVLPASAVFVGRTAAWMHGVDVEPANPIQVAVETLESRDGLEVTHADVSTETVDVKGRRATTLQRALLDLCSWSPLVEALIVIDAAIRRRVTTAAALLEYSNRRSSQLRKLAAIAAPAESPMETRLRWLLLEAGLPMPEVQVDLYDDSGNFLGRADLYYPSARLIIEFDGRNHQDRLVSDLRRQNALHAAGYNMLRFTSADLYGRPNEIVLLVRAALDKPLRPLVTSAVHRIG
jgi:very-short-patch-repair endonuclease